MHKVQTNYSSFTSRVNEIYAATLEALKKKERQGETQFTTKIEFTKC
jgi:hypothetical protein